MEPQLSQSSITAFANDHNLSIAIIDPLGGVEDETATLNLCVTTLKKLCELLLNKYECT